ncbi:MAG TPA: nucleotidyl transferase AbiEii/AbiGii toxin family protein [bacterium]|nr:nucleotidyl transferase AbiEii/AbiGii toxin family protein [bacterium]
MIRKQDILDRATEWQLRPEVVEKDYVLGWLLAGFGLSTTRTTWIFKGGTCIKKCFLETYRFSEDLDFSLLPEASYTQEGIHNALRDLTSRVSELSGIEFRQDQIEVRPRQNKQGQPTFECRIPYRGPLAYPGYPRILFDLTKYEPILDTPSSRVIFHPYPDALPDNIEVLTYSFDELLAEKTRALYERARPRDLYDVVYLLENRPDAFDFHHVRKLFIDKCAAKGLAPPSLGELIRLVEDDQELRSEWANMLAYQLPSLPDLDTLLRRLPSLLRWIDQPSASLPELMRAPAPIPAGTELIAPAGIRYWGTGLPLETIRFAGANRLLIEFDYDGRHRSVEPYSLHQARTGNILLYGWEQGSTHIKAFNTAKIDNLRVTSNGFEPRYRIEFSSAAPLSIPPSSSSSHGMYSSLSHRLTRSSASGRSSYGPRYVFECPNCQKRFTHTKNDPALRKHKAPDGYWDCPGRHGYLVEVR